MLLDYRPFESIGSIEGQSTYEVTPFSRRIENGTTFQAKGPAPPGAGRLRVTSHPSLGDS